MRMWPAAQRGAVGLFAVVVFCGCDSPKPGNPRGSGSVAISKDDALVYAVDTDNSLLAVVDAKTQKLVATVKVGARPSRVVVGPDETVYVANRGDRSISVVRKGEWTVAGTLKTDVDPVGLAVSADGKTVLVACATASDSAEVGTLAAFDPVSLQRSWTVRLPDEAAGVVLLDAHRAAVGLHRSGEVATVDLQAQQVTQASTGLYGDLNSSTFGGVIGNTSSAKASFHPRAITDLTVTPDGKRVYAVGQLATEAILSPPPPLPAGGGAATVPYYVQHGPGFAGSVSTAAVFGFDTDGVLVPAVDDLWNQPIDSDHPQTSYAIDGTTSDPLLQGQTAAVIDPNGDWLYLLGRESSTLMMVPATSRHGQQTLDSETGGTDFTDVPSVYAFGSVGAGADGLAVSGDGKTAWVYSQFDHQLSKLGQNDDGLAHFVALKTTATVAIANDTLDAVTAQGRRLFFDATDRRISGKASAIACATCHLEGRDDAHVWKFPDGPRQTPTLAGRGMLDTAPYHWSGEFATLTDFLTHTISTRMGGSGLDDASANALNQYIASLPSPENPNVGPQPTGAQLRGAALFSQAGCDACHSGKWLTNDMITDVGTLTATDQVAQLNVPSLRGLARSAPYLHDGSAQTLLERFQNNAGDRHGKTSALTADQLGDLVAYLQSL